MMGVLKLLSALFLLALLPPGLSHVVDKFSDVPDCELFFMEKKTPNLPSVLLDGDVKDQNRYKPICQYFEKKKKKEDIKKYTYASLYDTKTKIPVFSAYTFTGVGKSEERPKTWMIEPQLEKDNAVPLMQEEVPKETYSHQAVNKDYDDYGKENGVNKGHVFSKAFAHQPIDQLSTFSLTNAVPQVKTFNEGSWGNMERTVRKILLNQCVDSNGKQLAYLVTGALPSDKNTLNNRVNIPTVMWTAYCCYNSNTKKWVAQAHWGDNIKEEKGKTMTPKTLKQLEDMLEKSYGEGVKVFPSACPRDVIA